MLSQNWQGSMLSFTQFYLSTVQNVMRGDAYRLKKRLHALKTQYKAKIWTRYQKFNVRIAEESSRI